MRKKAQKGELAQCHKAIGAGGAVQSLGRLQSLGFYKAGVALGYRRGPPGGMGYDGVENGKVSWRVILMDR